MKCRAASDQSLLIELGDEIGDECHERVVHLLRAIEHAPPPWLRNLHPAYCSLLVCFDTLAVSHAEVEAEIQRFERGAGEAPEEPARSVEIPVCYGGEFGPDLAAVAAAHQLTPERVIEIHCGETYRAYFLGFAPGFAYLGDVPESIATARHASPRLSVPPGSVGLTGRQTGVYPFATPGGWQLIGRTPLVMFRAERSPMSRIALGDRVSFKPISTEEFSRVAALETAAAATEPT
ncbi:MAG: 5-oxoprolinase subunit PxpB [Candidatus Eiseniibacteriota bacterium]